MIRNILAALVLIPLAALIVLIAVANRSSVTIALDPFLAEKPALTVTQELPPPPPSPPVEAAPPPPATVEPQPVTTTAPPSTTTTTVPTTTTTTATTTTTTPTTTTSTLTSRPRCSSGPPSRLWAGGG